MKNTNPTKTCKKESGRTNVLSKGVQFLLH